MRKLLLQSLEQRCVLDADGFDTSSMETADQPSEISAMEYRYEKSDSDSDSSSMDEPFDFNDLIFMSFGAPDASSDGMDSISDELMDFSGVADDSDVGMESVQRSATDEMDIQGMDVETLEGILINAVEQFSMHYDVDSNGRLSELDALMIINSINEYSRMHNNAFLVQQLQSDQSFLDVNGDTLVTPLDVLIVINEINRNEAASGFGSSQLARVANDTIPGSDDEMALELPPFYSDTETVDSQDWSTELIDQAMMDFDQDAFEQSIVDASQMIAYDISTIDAKKSIGSVDEEESTLSDEELTELGTMELSIA
jgi:hypothetical protein